MKLRKIWTLMTSLLLGFCSALGASVSSYPLTGVIKNDHSVMNSAVVGEEYDNTATEVTKRDSYFTYKITNASKTAHSQSFTIRFDAEMSNYGYILGYRGEEALYRPLLAVYKLKNKTTNETEERVEQIAQVSENNIYDAIGMNTALDDQTFYLDFVFSSDEEFVDNSLVVYNIFEYKKDENNKVTIQKDQSYKCAIKNKASDTVDVEPYLSTTLENVSTFGSYTAFNIRYSNTLDELYKTKKASTCKKYQEKLDNGKYVIQSSITNVLTSTYRFEYSDGNVLRYGIEEYSITSSQMISLGESTACYMVNEVPMENLKSFSLEGVSLTIQIYSKSDDGVTKVIPNTALVVRIGCAYFANEPDDISKVGSTNVILILVIAVVCYLLVVLGAILGLYFYQKNKYKNDEFRRVNDRRFFRTAAIAYIGGLDALLAILFIVFRSISLGNTYTTFNPLDNFIVVTCILLIFFIGYFVKYFINFFKDHKSRKESEKLKLNESTDNDGTK
jgi:hypothetical protein